MVLDTPAASTQTWTAAGLANTATAHADGDHPLGASFDLPTSPGQVVNVKVGISFISTEQARANITAEAPANTFNAIRAASSSEWDQALSTIEVRGETPASVPRSTRRYTTPC